MKSFVVLMRKLRVGKHLLPLNVLVCILLISVLSLVSYAASVTATSTTTQAVQGVMFNVVGGFTAASNGFGLTPSSGSATSLPASWVSGNTVTTAVVAGNWQYAVNVTITAAASPSTTYTLSVQWNTGSGYGALGGSLTFTTPSSISAGQWMLFVLNTGVTTFNAPAALVITVQ